MWFDLKTQARQAAFVICSGIVLVTPIALVCEIAAPDGRQGFGAVGGLLMFCATCVLLSAITHASGEHVERGRGFPLDEAASDATPLDGSQADIGLTRRPLRLEIATGWADAGGVCSFFGTTRADDDGSRRIVALDYSGHEAMAKAQLADLARRARERWQIEGLVLKHRLGRVDVGEASVMIVVACPHRVEAFEACRWLIDTLKAELAVWKKDLYNDGTSAWTPGNREAFSHLSDAPADA